MIKYFFLTLLAGAAFSKELLSWENRCNDSWVAPPTIVNTTERLYDLREYMREYNISGYIISSNDEHQSEYVAEHDQRRAFISGFTGSAGEAVVTLNKAALWTDSRYYIQAGEQLDCNWELMPTGKPGTPSTSDWLMEQLDPGTFVSADSKTTPFTEWETLRTSLEKRNITLMPIMENLVDFVWGEEQPPYPDVPLFVLDLKYAGKGEPWEDKIKRIKMSMLANDLDALIVTGLDEIAWTLNLRGGDVPFTPVFRSHLVVEMNQSTLYLPSEKITDIVQNHLNSTEESLNIRNYEDIWNDLEDIGKSRKRIGVPKSFSYAPGASYLIHTMLPADRIQDVVSPPLIFKDYKNEAEEEGMKSAHIKDAVALSVFFARLSKEIAEGSRNWTELSAVAVLDDLRWKQPLSKGPSFSTIAAVGPNAALPHYEPSNATDRVITDSEVFLVDSGGQYLDGTTDVTRTVHFGTPKEREITVYTELLMGCIDIVTTLFPEGKTMNDLEILIRRPLYSLGMDYGHGSTHGIGALLSVHESFNTTFHRRFFGSQEPGYYQEDDFGIRLENIVSVIQANPLSGATNYLTFEPITLMPYERKMINVTLLEKRHIKWINEYNLKIRDKVGTEMLKQGYTEEHSWLLQQTEPLSL